MKTYLLPYTLSFLLFFSCHLGFSQLSYTTTILQPADCFGNNASVSVSVQGGSGSYEVTLWSNNFLFGNPAVDTFSVNGVGSSINGNNFHWVSIDDLITGDYVDGIVYIPINDLHGALVVNASTCVIDLAPYITPAGTPPYSVNIYGISTQTNPIYLNSGTYTASVTDAIGCPVYTGSGAGVPIIDWTLFVTNAGPDTVTDVQNLSCGSSLTWIDGNTYASSNNTASYITTDPGGCQTLSLLDLTIETNITDSIFACDSLLWIDGITYTASNNTATYTVTDTAGCDSVITLDLLIPDPISVTSNLTSNTCTNSPNGQISVNVVGGNAPYNFSWSTGDATQNIIGLGPGMYTLTLSDACGKSYIDSFEIQNISPITILPSIMPDSCPNMGNGQINLSISNGFAPYSYSWSNGSSTQNLSGITNGTYTVTATDACGNTLIDSFLLMLAPPFQVTSIITGNTCNLIPNGNILLNITGGGGSYSYSWSNGATTKDIYNLPAGVYNVMVTDSCGNTLSESYTVSFNSPPPLQITNSITPNSCPLNPDGHINLTIYTGTGPYTYSWSNGGTTEDISGVPNGLYSVLIFDACGNSFADSFQVQSINPLQIAASISPNTCALNPNGSVALSLSNAIAPYTFSWSNGASTQNINNLSTGIYSVNFSDACGNSFTDSFQVQSINPLQVSSSISPNTCLLAPNGEILLNGPTSYSYLWSNGDTTQNLYNLSAGTYSILISDSCGNDTTQSFIVTNPAPTSLQVSNNIIPSQCPFNPTGAINLSITNNPGSLFFNWSNGDTTQNITGVSSGNYFVNIHDGCNSLFTDTFTVSELNTLDAQTFIDHTTCPNDPIGNIFTLASGGSGGYSFLWSTGDTLDKIINQTAGIYTLILSDNCGNTRLDTFEIIASNTNPPEDASFNYANNNYNQYGVSTSPTITGISGGTFSTNSSSLIINSNTGEIDLCTSLPGNYIINYQTPGIVDCPGIDSFTLQINPSPDLTIASTITQPDCVGDLTGEIQISASGGRMPYTANWSFGASALNLTNLTGGTYMVSIIDDCLNQIDTAITLISIFPQDDATFSFDSLSFCIDGTNPVPSIIDTGIFSADSVGLVFADATTGEIDLQQSVSGTYQITHTTTGNCPDTSLLEIVVEVCGVEIESWGELASLKIYPNPTSGKITIELDKSYPSLQTKVFNVHGQLVSTGSFEQVESFELNLEGAVGFYFVEIITSENTNATFKILKE